MTEKPNCSTCPHSGLDEDIQTCELAERWMEIGSKWLINEVGCLSHPGAREWMMRDVVKELERRSIKCGLHEDYDKSDTYNKAIALIRGEK